MDERQAPPSLEEVLSHAVERQIAEQRALRDALSELSQSVRSLTDRPASSSLDAASVEESVHRAVSPSIASLIDQFRELQEVVEAQSESAGRTHRSVHAVGEEFGAVRNAIKELARGQSERLDETTEAVKEEVAATREAVKEEVTATREAIDQLAKWQLERSTDTSHSLRQVGEEMASVRDSIGAVAADIEGIARALIDLNSGLRSWSDDLDQSVAGLRTSVEEIRELSIEPEPEPEPRFEEKEPEPQLAIEPVGSGELISRVAVVEDRLQETAQLSLYLSDQIQDLDRLMGRLTELPTKLEGSLSQILRRTLAVRSQMDQEADSALDEALAVLDDRVERLTSAVNRLEESEGQFRKIEISQSELASRIESLRAEFVTKADWSRPPRPAKEERQPEPKPAKSAKPKAKPRPAKPKAPAKKPTPPPAARKRTPAPQPATAPEPAADLDPEPPEEFIGLPAGTGTTRHERPRNTPVRPLDDPFEDEDDDLDIELPGGGDDNDDDESTP